VARRRRERQEPPPQGGVVRPDGREHRRRVDGRRHRGAHRTSEGPREALHSDHRPRLHAVLSQLSAPGVRAVSRRRHRRGRVADVGRSPQPRGALPVADHAHVAVASAIYAWAIAPSRRHAERNPLRLVELPPTTKSCGSGSHSRRKPSSCSTLSEPRTRCRTRSPSTRASAAPRSRAWNGRTCSRADGSGRVSSSPAPRASRPRAPATGG
jgi:hypothetical protein